MAKDGLSSFDGPTRRAAAAGMFNSEQVSWMKYLSTLPPEKKCKCGWDLKGKCHNPQCKEQDDG